MRRWVAMNQLWSSPSACCLTLTEPGLRGSVESKFIVTVNHGRVKVTDEAIAQGAEMEMQLTAKSSFAR